MNERQIPVWTDAEYRAISDALDNSQSLLVMILHLGDDENGLGIMPSIWNGEDLSKLLTEQIVKNRRALALTSQDRGSK